MSVLKNIFIVGMVGIFGMLVGYEIAGPVAVKDFTVLYSLNDKQNDKALVAAIDDAHRFVFFAIYEFTKENIADALIRARKHGLIVQGIVDVDQSRNGAQANVVQELRSAGISIEFQKHEKGIMHLKMLVTDRAYAIGSYNWTTAATMVNDEILEIGTAGPLRQEYLSILKKVLEANQ